MLQRMDSAGHALEIEAATAMWPVLWSFAQDSHALSGRGAVLMERESLLDPGRGGGHPVMNYIAAEDVPAGDDFRALMLSHDPSSQVVLIIGGGGADEIAIVVEGGGLNG